MRTTGRIPTVLLAGLCVAMLVRLAWRGRAPDRDHQSLTSNATSPSPRRNAPYPYGEKASIFSDAVSRQCADLLRAISEFEAGKPNEAELCGILAAIHPLVVDPATRGLLLKHLAAMCRSGTSLMRMLSGTLVAGLEDSAARSLPAKLLEQGEAKLKAWIGKMLTMNKVDDRPPDIADREERFKAFMSKKQPKGFNLKDYEFFWDRCLWDLCAMHRESLSFAQGFLERCDARSGISYGVVDTETVIYSRCFSHELNDPPARAALIEALEAEANLEDRFALFSVVSYKADGKPWPDLIGFYALSAVNRTEHPLIRYKAINSLRAVAAEEYRGIFRETFCAEAYAESPNLTVARSALEGLLAVDRTVVETDSQVLEAVVEYVRHVALDANYRDQLGGILGELKITTRPQLSQKLLSLAEALGPQGDSLKQSILGRQK